MNTTIHQHLDYQGDRHEVRVDGRLGDWPETVIMQYDGYRSDGEHSASIEFVIFIDDMDEADRRDMFASMVAFGEKGLASLPLMDDDTDE